LPTTIAQSEGFLVIFTHADKVKLPLRVVAAVLFMVMLWEPLHVNLVGPWSKTGTGAAVDVAVVFVLAARAFPVYGIAAYFPTVHALHDASLAVPDTVDTFPFGQVLQ
jgi:hypothetical protein